MSMSDSQIRGYDDSKQYSKESKTNTLFALIKSTAVAAFRPIVVMFF